MCVGVDVDVCVCGGDVAYLCLYAVRVTFVDVCIDGYELK